MRIIPLFALLLLGCSKVEPPSDTAIAAASQNRQVFVFYNGHRYIVECR